MEEKKTRRKLFRAIRKKHVSGADLEKKNKRKCQNLQAKRKRKSFQSQVEVKRKSKQQHLISQIVQRYHLERLDNLLAGNGMNRVSMPADGDCFFSSLLLHLDNNWNWNNFVRKYHNI